MAKASVRREDPAKLQSTGKGEETEASNAISLHRKNEENRQKEG